MSNYYDLLGISKTATIQEIKSAYKKQALKFHPDRNAGNPEEAQLAEERFKLINEAYQVLSDPFKKSSYDNQLEYDEVTRQRYYKQYTSSGNYSDYQSNNSNQNTGYTYQRRETKKEKQPTFVFGKTEMYIVLGFALMSVFAYFLMNIMTNYSYTTYMEEAKVAIELGNFSAAKKALEEAQTQKEKDAEINYLLGVVEVKFKKDYPDAIEFFDKAIYQADKDDNEARAKYAKIKADTYLLMNEYYKATEEYINVIGAFGYDQEVIMNIADLYLDKLKDYNKASLYFDKIIEKEPQLVEPYIGKAVAKHKSKDYEAMGELLDKAIKINPKNPYLWYYKGFYFWEKPTSDEEVKTKDKKNACESWKIAFSYGNEDAQKPLNEYCK
ncbi:DnaJ domain-containing protein [Bernardetia sp. OM2101]|uniref:tetratricopeptide repeat protein n=1 Tax=Bernardetia sp. OM2101 TaxID=3344876 RepID=UPI0035CFAA34